MSAKKTKRIQIVQTRSAIRHYKSQGATLQALGLGKIGRTVEHDATPSTMGMVKKVSHLVEVSPVE